MLAVDRQPVTNHSPFLARWHHHSGINGCPVETRGLLSAQKVQCSDVVIVTVQQRHGRKMSAPVSEDVCDGGIVQTVALLNFLPVLCRQTIKPDNKKVSCRIATARRSCA